MNMRLCFCFMGCSVHLKWGGISHDDPGHKLSLLSSWAGVCHSRNRQCVYGGFRRKMVREGWRLFVLTVDSVLSHYESIWRKWVWGSSASASWLWGRIGCCQLSCKKHTPPPSLCLYSCDFFSCSVFFPSLVVSLFSCLFLCWHVLCFSGILFWWCQCLFFSLAFEPHMENSLRNNIALTAVLCLWSFAHVIQGILYELLNLLSPQRVHRLTYRVRDHRKEAQPVADRQCLHKHARTYTHTLM